MNGDRRLIKIYGLFLAIIGCLMLILDIIIMSVSSEVISFSINPLKMLVEFMNNMIAYGTRYPAIIVSEFFMVISLALFVAFLINLFGFIKASPSEKKAVVPAVLFGLSFLTWMIHAICSAHYFTMRDWHFTTSYYERKFVALECLILWGVSLLFVFLSYVIPVAKAKGFRKIIGCGLTSMALLCMADLMLFGIINMLFKGVSIAEFPFLSFFATIFLGLGGFLLSESIDLMKALQNVDKRLRFSTFLGPFVRIMDRDAQPGEKQDLASAPAEAPRGVTTAPLREEPRSGDIAPAASPEKKAPQVESSLAEPLITGELPEAGKPGMQTEAQLEAQKESHPTAQPEARPPAKLEAQAAPKASDIPGDKRVHIEAARVPEPVSPAATREARTESEIQPQGKKSGPLIAIIIIGLFLMMFIVVAGVGWYFVLGPGKSLVAIETASPSPVLSESVTPKPSPTLIVQANAVASPSPSPKESEAPHKKPHSRKDITFTDIAESIFSSQIVDLARLDIFESITGEFRPNDPITRAEYVRWLVKANNAFFPIESGNFIKVAESGACTFEDVPMEHLDWKWIQGMANAGYVIGYDEKHFRPEKDISREEMMAIRCGLEYNITLKDIERTERDIDVFKKDLEERFNDASKVERKYIAAYFKDMDNSFAVLRSVFGTVRILLPQEKLARSEAAASIWTLHRKSAKEVIKEWEN